MKWVLFVVLLGTFELIAAVTVTSPWVRPLRTPNSFGPSPHERTRPIVLGDILYAASNSGRLVAIHRTKNNILWEKDLGAGVDGSLTYARSKLFVGDTQGNLWEIQARDGSSVWNFKIQSEWLAPVLVWREKVFSVASNDEFYVLSEKEGHELHHYSGRGEEKMTLRGDSSAAAFGGDVYQGFSTGVFTALSSQQLKPVWNKRLRTKARFFDIDSTPYVDEKTILVSAMDGNTYQLDRLTGNIQWTFPKASYGGFLVDSDKVYLSTTDSSVYALDKKTGAVLWRTVLEKGIGLTPTKVGDYLAVTTTADPVYLLDLQGQIQWRGYLGAGTFAAAAAGTEGWFYVLSNFGNLFAFRIYANDPGRFELGLPLRSPDPLHPFSG